MTAAATIADDLLAIVDEIDKQLALPRVTQLWLPQSRDVPPKSAEFGALVLDDGSVGLLYVLLGDTLKRIGTLRSPADLVGAVLRGIDMFDCVLPTRSGRTGQAFTRRGTINIKNARHGDDPRPLDPECTCPACRDFSRAYLSHLARSNEILGAMLLTWHNLRYYQDLMAGLRTAIGAGKVVEFAEKFAADYAAGDIDLP